jgi:hypothetical protein
LSVIQDMKRRQPPLLFRGLAGNTKRGSISLMLTSCLTSLD